MRVLAQLPAGGYLPDRVVNYALQLLEYAVPKPGPYKVLAPALPELLLRVVFPLLCFNADDAALWESDPHEYIRKGYDIIEDMYSPRTAAMNFISELLRVRKAEQLHFFVSFLVSVLQRCGPGTPPETRPYAELDGALFALGSLVDVLKRMEPYNTQLEAMLIAHVLPEFANPRGHLRAKAAWVAGMYADTHFVNPDNFSALFQRVIGALRDPELPVRVDAVISLRAFVDAADENAVNGLRPILPQLLNELFRLMAEVENEDLVCTLEAIVSRYGEEMVPFANGLVTNLVAAFWRAMNAGDEAGSDDDDDGTGALACLGCLRTIATILDAVTSQPALYPSLEAQLLPVMQRMLSMDGQDVYEEVLEILAYITYYSPTISDAMWALFPVLLSNVNEWALDYFEATLTSLDNYVSRDPARFVAGTDARGVPHTDAVFSLAAAILTSADYEEEDCVCAPQLLSVVLVHCRGRVDRWVLPYVQLAASRLGGERPAQLHFLRDLLLLLWAHAIIYDARAALAAAASIPGALPLLFGSWTAALSARKQKTGKRVHFRREQDKKVCALALTSLLLLPADAAPEDVRAAGPALAAATLALLSELKEQRAARLKREEEEERDEGVESDDDDDDDSDDGRAGVEEDDDPSVGGAAVGAAGGVTSAPAAWGGYRGRHADDDDDESDGWSDYTADEDDAQGPIDDIDPWIFFADGLTALASQDPARFAALRGGLDFHAQALLEATGQYAATRRGEIAAEAARAAAAAAATAAGAP
jgi:hypothetical protein